MYSFTNDYSEGAHPRILKAMMETNLTQNTGYSQDIHTTHAIDLIRSEIKQPNADIHIIAGGTQTNLITISAALRPHQAVISAVTGHINVHETGAIEATGHKVLAMETKDGKLTPNLVLQALEFHTDEHMVQPKMVYISNSTVHQNRTGSPVPSLPPKRSLPFHGRSPHGSRPYKPHQ